MYKDVVSVNYRCGYKIEVIFEDGAGGLIDFSKYLSKGGGFDKFKDIEFFKSFQINDELGVLTWQNEIDIAPEILYAEATGEQLPNWMDSQATQPSKNALQSTF